MQNNELNTIVDFSSTLIDVDEGNKVCNDCKSDNPTYASINNGIVLCAECASVHTTLGYSISYIRKISDNWDNNLMNYMIMGGNSKYQRSMSILGLDENLPINIKYRTNASDFYRRNLKRKVNNLDILEVDYDNPNDICIESKELFKEFENYIISDMENKQKSKSKFGFFSKLGNTIFNVGKSGFNKLKKAGNYVATKAQPATNKIKQGASYIATKAQPATNKIKQGASYIGSKVKTGTNYITTHAKSTISHIKQKIGINGNNNNNIKGQNQEVNQIIVNSNQSDIKLDDNTNVTINTNTNSTTTNTTNNIISSTNEIIGATPQINP